jgi:hypothetical protein
LATQLTLPLWITVARLTSADRLGLNIDAPTTADGGVRFAQGEPYPGGLIIPFAFARTYEGVEQRARRATSRKVSPKNTDSRRGDIHLSAAGTGGAMKVKTFTGTHRTAVEKQVTIGWRNLTLRSERYFCC